MNNNDPAPTRDHYRHFSTITTRWTDNDVYHHVNNALYYNFFDTVIAGYLINEGGFELASAKIIGLAVESSCRYRRPLAFPEEIHMGLRVAHLGNSSVRYEVGVFAASDRQAAADGYFVHVFVDRATNKPSPIGGQLRIALERILVG